MSPRPPEQSLASDVVDLLALAGRVARRDGRREVEARDLRTALGERSPSTAPPSSSDASARVTPYRDGPYLLRGAFELCDQDGNPIPTGRSTVALCRCGRSQLRPFCDGTHKLIGFQAASGAERSAETGGA